MTLFLDSSVLLAACGSRKGVFTPAEDRPILFSALAWSDVLVTLDSKDFGELLGSEFYGLPVLRPTFLEREHAMNRLR